MQLTLGRNTQRSTVKLNTYCPYPYPWTSPPSLQEVFWVWWKIMAQSQTLVVWKAPLHCVCNKREKLKTKQKIPYQKNPTNNNNNNSEVYQYVHCSGHITSN